MYVLTNWVVLRLQITVYLEKFNSLSSKNLFYNFFFEERFCQMNLVNKLKEIIIKHSWYLKKIILLFQNYYQNGRFIKYFYFVVKKKKKIRNNVKMWNLEYWMGNFNHTILLTLPPFKKYKHIFSLSLFFFFFLKSPFPFFLFISSI